MFLSASLAPASRDVPVAFGFVAEPLSTTGDSAVGNTSGHKPLGGEGREFERCLSCDAVPFGDRFCMCNSVLQLPPQHSSISSMEFISIGAAPQDHGMSSTSSNLGIAQDHCVVLLLDATLPRNEMRSLCDSLLAALSLPEQQHRHQSIVLPTTRISVLAVSNAVFVYELGSGLAHHSACVMASAEALPMFPNEAQIRRLVTRIDRFSVPLAECRPGVLPAIFDCIVQSCPSSRNGSSTTPRCRASGAALEVAVSLLSGDVYRKCDLSCPVLAGHVMAFVGGAATHGPGSLDTIDDERGGAGDVFHQRANSSECNAGLAKYYARLGDMALNSGVVVDVVCSGVQGFRAAELGELPRACGGSLSTLPSLSDSKTVEQMIRLGFGRMLGVRVSCELRTSAGVQVVDCQGSICGKVRTIAGRNGGSNSASSYLSFTLGAATSNSCISVFLKMQGQPTSVAVQLLVRYADLHNRLVTRVHSAWLPVAQDQVAFYKSIDPKVSAVLLAKQLVARVGSSLHGSATTAITAPSGADRSGWDFGLGALLSKALSMDWAGTDLGTQSDEGEAFLRQNVDSLAGTILGATSTLSGFIFSELGKGKTEDLADILDPNILEVLNLLYFLRRGPLLNTMLQNFDDIDCARRLFAGATLDNSLLWIRPALYVLTAEAYNEWAQRQATMGDSGAEESTPFSAVLPVDVALRSDVLLILDHAADVFVWSGLALRGLEYDPMREFALNRVVASIRATRFPAVRVMTFVENDSMARYLSCRVAPAHRDSLEELRRDVPQLAALPDDALKALSQKFRGKTDERSFRQYLRHIAHR